MHRKVPNKAVFKAFLFVKPGYTGIAAGYSGIKQLHSNRTATAQQNSTKAKQIITNIIKERNTIIIV